jgi:predicted transcriptional regulator
MNGTQAIAERMDARPCREFSEQDFFGGTDVQTAPREFEQAVIPLLRSVQRRMTPDEIVSTLHARGFPYSMHTVRTYLSRLVSKGVLTSSRKKPFGYCLAGDRLTLSSSVTEQDIVETLGDVGFRMTKRALQAALYQRGLDWEEASLNRELARLVESGRITYQPYWLPPGYGLPQWGNRTSEFISSD